MSNPYAPDSLATIDAIVAYLQAATLTDGVTLVYAPLTNALGQSVASVQEGRFRDIGDYLPDGATNAICEVWPADDDNELYGFGGATRDNQTYLIMSICSMSNAKAAVRQILTVRDAIIPIFRQHVTLNATGNVIKATFKPQSGKFTPVYRGKKEYMGYGFELATEAQWQVQGGILA